MTGYRLTPEAESDLFEIWRYIAQENPDAADRVEAAVYRACSFLAGAPQSGQMRKELAASNVRFWAVQQFPNYFVVYRAETRPVEIVRVLHGMRDIKNIL